MYLLGLIGSVIALWYLLVIGGGLLMARDMLPMWIQPIYEGIRDSWDYLLEMLVYLLSYVV